MKKYTIITSVGTSMLTNYKGSFRESDRAIGGETLDNAAVVVKKALEFQYADFRKAFQLIEGQVGGYVPKYWFKGIKKVDGQFEKHEDSNTLNIHASAEITSLVNIIKNIRKPGQAARITVQLIATDTALSVLCALLVKAWLEQPEAIQQYSARVRFDKNTDFIPDLRVDLPADWKDKPDEEQRRYYDLGLQNLTDKLVGEKGYLKSHKGAQVIINFSGGYKSIIPILTIIAQLEGIPMQYIFEDSDYLVEVGALPIKWDWEIIEKYIGYIQDTGTIRQGSDVESELFKLNIIQKENDTYSLTIVGKLLSDYLQRDIPFVKTIIGYAIEHKLGSYYRLALSDFEEVIEGYRPTATRDVQGENWVDIDLILKRKTGSWIAVTIKPDSFKARSIRNELKKLKERIQNANLDGFGVCDEVWLFLHGDESRPASSFQPNQIQDFKDCVELNVPFSIKRLTYRRNAVDGRDNRFSFHDFMRNEIQEAQIQTIYPKS